MTQEIKPGRYRIPEQVVEVASLSQDGWPDDGDGEEYQSCDSCDEEFPVGVLEDGCCPSCCDEPVAPSPDWSELGPELVEALAPFMPITTRMTPDYAEVTFGEHQTQAMSMAPDDWLKLSAIVERLTVVQP